MVLVIVTHAVPLDSGGGGGGGGGNSQHVYIPVMMLGDSAARNTTFSLPNSSM